MRKVCVGCGEGLRMPAADSSHRSVLDIPLILTTLLPGVALVLATCGIALLVRGPAVDLALVCLLLGSLVHVPACLTLLRLIGCLSSTRKDQKTSGGKHACCAAPASVSQVDRWP